ncbi:MAG: hypothetical protein KJP06_04215 [Deltaproteobacteria bacterium]|nr:hypothetical protein [Deltaproteobacteria bacterium]
MNPAGIVFLPGFLRARVSMLADTVGNHRRMPDCTIVRFKTAAPIDHQNAPRALRRAPAVDAL